MIDIKTALANILKAKYGKDVRQSIHDAIFQMDANANEAVEVAITSKESAKAYAEEAETKANFATTEADRAEAAAVDAADMVDKATEEADRAKAEADRAEAIVDIGPATTERLGLIKPDGTSVTVDEDGTLHSKGGGSADVSVDNETISQAEDGTISVMKEALDVIIEDITKEEYERRVAAGEITEDDVKYYNITDDEGGTGTELKPATKETLGGVIVGEGLEVDEDGVISADIPEINPASKTEAGIVKIGDGINVDEEGVVSALGLPTTMPELDTSWTVGSYFDKAGDRSGGFFRIGDLVYVNIRVRTNNSLPKSSQNVATGFPNTSKLYPNPLQMFMYWSDGKSAYANITGNRIELAPVSDTSGNYIQKNAMIAISGFYYADPES